MNNKVTCSCGWSWNKSDSSKKDMYVCHQCGKDNTMKNGGWLSKYNDVPEAQNGIEGTMGGLTDKGFDYNGAWGGTMQMGGSLPGTVGFTYARTQSPAPSNGKYAKKTKASAQNGKEMKFYQNGLDFTPKTISQDGEIIQPINGGTLQEVTVSGKMPNWAKYKNEAESKFTLDNYIDKRLPAYARAMGTNAESIHPNDLAAYNKYINDQVAKRVLAEKPKLKNSDDRVNWLKNFTDREKEIVSNSNYASKLQPSALQEFENFILGNNTSGVNFKSKGTTSEEAKEHQSNPASMMAPLVIPGKMVQSMYKPGYSFGDAIQGRANDAGLVESVITDPFTYLGTGVAKNVGKGISKGAVNAGRFLTEETALKNAFNYLPEGTFQGYSKLRNPNNSYRVAGLDAAEDFINTGILRSNPTIIKADFKKGILPTRTTPFPSFQKGYADLAYLPEQGGVVFETNLPTFKRGQLNPVTGDIIKGSHYAHRVIDPKTGGVVSEIPGADIKMYEGKSNWLQGYKEVPKPAGSVNNTPIVVQNAVPNPVAIVDKIIPRPLAPGHFLGMEDSWNNYSPLNFIPGYGKKLSAESELFKESVTDGFGKKVLRDNIKPQYGNSPPVGFRKFGNSIKDVVNRKVLGPKGSGMGSSQIKNEGNWAEPGKVNEHYPGVFEATMNPNIEGSDILLKNWSNRNGIVGTLNDGNVDIPLSDPGLSFNRRLPFSNRYVSVDKNKLANNQFQLATQLPHLQSLIEKYGLYAGGAGLSGYAIGGKDQAQKNIDFINQYTLDPALNYLRQGYDQYKKVDDKFNKTIKSLSKKKNGGWLSKYEDGGIIKDDMGQWAHPGEITEIGSNQITMEGVPYPVLGISDTGDTQMMYPGEEYNYDGESVTEIPMMPKAQFGFESVTSKSKPKIIQEDMKYVGAPINTLHIKDARKYRATTGKPIVTTRDLLTGNYDTKEHLNDLMQKVKSAGLNREDATNMLAMALAETQLGKTDDNLGHVLDTRAEEEENLNDVFVKVYKEKQALANAKNIKDPALRLQVYNGLGKVFPKTEKDYHGFEMKSIYGVPLTPAGIDMKKNPLYGKNVIDVRDNVLLKNKDVVDYVNLYYQKNGGQVSWLEKYK
jgi:hypothetical protein